MRRALLAGTNIACLTINATNDMPICDPGGLDALGMVPFQINPHCLHGNPPGFMGERREERITEFGVLYSRSSATGARADRNRAAAGPRD